MTKTLGFGADARLRKNREFRQVLAQGQKSIGRSLTIWHRIDPTGHEPKLGVSVSSKVAQAVRRSRLKRLLREAFRLQRSGLAPGLQVIASPRPGCPWRNRTEAERDLFGLLRQSGHHTP